MSTPITAIISKEWKQRILLIAAAIGGLGGWFLFDGAITYPKNNEKARVYFELRDRLGENTPEFESAWTAARQERAWSEKAPKKIYSEGDIQTQFVLGGLSILAAVGILVYFFRSLPTTTRLVDGKILLPNGREIPVTSVRAVSKKRWENKGIADLVYEPEPGKAGKFILDDYKYIGAADILAVVEKHLENAPAPGESTPPVSKPKDTSEESSEAY